MFRYLLSLLFVFALVACPSVGRADTLSSEVSKALTDQIGRYRARGPVAEPQRQANAPVELDTIAAANRTYSGPNGPVGVSLYQAGSDAEAYSLFTALAPKGSLTLGDVGTASITTDQSILFVRGRSVALIAGDNKISNEHSQLAKELATKLNSGDNDIPVLVRHLPNWETARNDARYVTTLRHLKALFPDQPVLDVVSFEAGADAVTSNYDGSRLVIIEFTTPQHASDNDRFIRAKLNELNGINQSVGGQKVPTAYRRVGNYAVFVFEGSDKQAAENLINEVKYEQVTQWLGENPYPLLEAQEKYVTTTLGVLVSVVKSTGLALVACFSIGGLFGGLLFLRRRSRQRAVEAYSDAGGMLRLNLDELTPETDPRRLIGPN